ncbi:MAG: tetratricopeptide repeat protein [Parasphingopyxis sp.]|nr:tetratricopeptide repeat protein [Sphingomonadales bacterium]
MSFLLFAAMLQAAPPVIDPILEPRRDESRGAERAPAPAQANRRLGHCAELSASEPEAAIAEGARWLLENGGVDAEQCLGIGYAAAERWDEAVGAFDRGAASASAGRRLALMAQAGNALLASGDAEAARSRFDTLLAVETLGETARGEALVDRARALVALGDGPAAQADLTAAQALLPNDPLVWLLSATLARRQGELEAAGDFIDRALELDEENPASLLEAGNIAIGLNAYGVAREAWSRALALEPDGDAGQAAARNLARLAEMTGDEGSVPVELPEEEPSE